MGINLLLILVPVSMILGYALDAGPLWVFGTAVVAIVPLAEWVRRGTEQMAAIAGPAIGGLLNVTFGNVTELVLALFVLMAGHPQVVKAQITGAIIGNGLLGLGLAIVFGSMASGGRERQRFNRQHAGLLSSLLILSVIALMVPALFNYTERGLFASPLASELDEKLSLGVSIVLILLYIANLIHTLVTHRTVFATEEEKDQEKHEVHEQWPAWKAMAVLLGGTLLLAVEAELVSGALEGTAAQLGLSTFFLGVVVLAVIGNAAEYISAIYFARQDRMSLVLSITLGSTIQIALLVAPLLVLISYFLGHPMNLVFENPLELIAIAGVAFAVNAIAHDGETNWFEGVLLLGVYAVLVLAFFFATPPPGA